CASAGMTPSPAGPQPPGTSVTLTASSTGCSTGEYKFWLRAPGASSFSVLRDYGAAAFTWNTTGLASGTYTFGVWARAVGSSAVVDAGMEQAYLLQANSTSSSSVMMASDQTRLKGPGTTWMFKEHSTCCMTADCN